MVRSPDRRPKRDQPGASTRERLLAATVASCVEHGYRGATLADIASRAGVSAPAIYNHFGDRAELLVEAGRWALDRLEPRPPGATPSAATAVHVFLGDGFAETRRFLVELHLAAQRDPRRRRPAGQVARRSGVALGRAVAGPRRRGRGEDLLRRPARALPVRRPVVAAGLVRGRRGPDRADAPRPVPRGGDPLTATDDVEFNLLLDAFQADPPATFAELATAARSTTRRSQHRTTACPARSTSPARSATT